VAVRDVEELHHVGFVLALALERAGDLLADRRAVIRKRHQPRLVPAGFQPVAQQLGLRLLSALVQPFERNERHYVVSSEIMSSIDSLRLTPCHFPLSMSTSSGSGWRL